MQLMGAAPIVSRSTIQRDQHVAFVADEQADVVGGERSAGDCLQIELAAEISIGSGVLHQRRRGARAASHLHFGLERDLAIPRICDAPRAADVELSGLCR
jgi:hypothetical protein